MNPLMIQQAMVSARTLPLKASTAGNGGEFEAIAQSLLGGVPASKGRDAQTDAANPLAALLLAALFTQPQAQPAVEEIQTTEAGSDCALGALNSLGAQPQTERLATLLQALGMNADEASAFATQLADTIQAARTTQADQHQEAQAAAQTVQEDPVAQVRTLLDNLLSAVTDTTVEQTLASPDIRLSVGMAIKLRALLSDLRASQPATGNEAAAQDAAQTVTQSAPPVVAATSTASAQTASQDSSAAQQSADDASQQNTDDTAGLTQNANVLPFAAPQRAQAAAQEPQPRSVTRTLGEAFDTMVDTLSALRQGPRSEMEIHLKPDFLGKVIIKLTMEEGSLVARISASSASVQDAFQAQAPSLTTALQQQGIKDVTVLVAHDAAAGSALDQSTSSRHNQNPREQRRRTTISMDAADKSDAVKAAQAYEQFWRSGTINYLA